MDMRDHAVGVASLFLTAVCWGFVASTVKRLTAEVDPYTISFFRVSLATAVFLILLALQRKSLLHIQWFLPWIALGALGRAGNYLLYNAGLVYMPSNAVTILAPVQTIAVVLLAKWILSEKARPKWLGLSLSLSGLLLIWWNGQGWKTLMEPRYYGGNALLVLAGVASALQFISQKALSSRLSSLEILLPVFGWSTVLTLPFAWGIGALGQSYSLATWLLLLFLGLVLTGGSFFFLAEGYQRCAATTAVVITNTTVFWTLIWSHYLLHESVGVIMVMGALLGVAGAVLVVRADRRAIERVPAS